MSEEEKLYPFAIPCSWQYYGTINVEARDLDHAIHLAEEEQLPDGDYMDGSFEIDCNFAEDRNSEVIEQIKKDNEKKSNPLGFIVSEAFPIKE